MRKQYNSVLDHPRKKHAMKIYGKDPETLDELFESIIVILNRYIKDEGVTVVGLDINMTSSQKVANTHYCPLLGGTNWGFENIDKDVPQGYPGFGGIICIRFSKQNNVFGHSYMNNTLVHTGTGGGGHYGPWQPIVTAFHLAPKYISKTFIKPNCLGWDFKVFLDDFPKLKNTIEKQWTADMLTHGKTKSVTYKKTWTDPKQSEKDQEFIDVIKKSKSRRVLITMK